MPNENVTIRERIILHLSRFPEFDPGEIYNVPFDLTQDGIASVLGISRAHASLELKKLKEAGKVDDWLAHIKGSGSKRKAYCLLAGGRSESELLKVRFESSGIVIDTLLDMKRCDPLVMWEALSTADRETFGLACVFRVPIPRKSIPDTSTGIIPTDFDGMIRISDAVRSKYLSVVDSEKIKAWHSRASDWWMDNGDDQERLYHLMMAGRNTEACKLLMRRSDYFLENPNEDLLNTVRGITAAPKYTEAVYALRARIALDCSDAKDALACAAVLDDFRTIEPGLIRAEARMVSGEPEESYISAHDIFLETGSSRAALIAARALFSMRRYDDAGSFLNSAYHTLSENSDASRMADIMLLRAGIAYENGRNEEALSYLNKAGKICRRDSMKERIGSIESGIRNGDLAIRFQ